MSVEEPLIHTIRGNLPVSSLKHEFEWRVSYEMIVFIEKYTAEDGVVVRQDAHLYDKVGVEARIFAQEQAQVSARAESHLQ